MSRRPLALKPRSSPARPTSGSKGEPGPGFGLGSSPPSIAGALGNRALGSLLDDRLDSSKEPLFSRIGGGVALTVYFGKDQFVLDGRSVDAVRALAQEFELMIEPTVRVDGHASTEGAEDHNLRLSKMRRELVVALLAAQTSPTTSFGGTPHGESDPSVVEVGEGEALEEKRACNRRVEIIVVPKRFPISPEAEAEPEPKKDPFRFRPRIPFRPETTKERLDRMLRERVRPPEKRGGRSLEDLADETLDDIFDGLLEGIVKDKDKRRWLTERLRDGVKAGGKKAVEGIVDGTDLPDETKDAIKRSIEAGTKQRF